MFSEADDFINIFSLVRFLFVLLCSRVYKYSWSASPYLFNNHKMWSEYNLTLVFPNKRRYRHMTRVLKPSKYKYVCSLSEPNFLNIHTFALTLAYFRQSVKRLYICPRSRATGFYCFPCDPDPPSPPQALWHVSGDGDDTITIGSQAFPGKWMEYQGVGTAVAGAHLPVWWLGAGRDTSPYRLKQEQVQS